VKSYLSGRIEKHRALSFIKRSLKVLLSPKTHFDFFVVDDPRPCFVQWANVVVLSASGFFRRAIALFSRNLSLLFRIDALMLSSSRRALARTTGKRILVVCTGNRCRSPFVEQLLKADMAQSSIQVCSAGLKVQESNIPERFIGVFRRFGLNPRSHVAHAVCDSDIENADLIVLMERSHWWQIFFKFGFPAVRKSILLTAIDANEYNLKIEIPDPYLQSPWDAEHTFAWLHSLVQKLSTQIQEIHRLVDYEF